MPRALLDRLARSAPSRSVDRGRINPSAICAGEELDQSPKSLRLRGWALAQAPLILTYLKVAMSGWACARPNPFLRRRRPERYYQVFTTRRRRGGAYCSITEYAIQAKASQSGVPVSM